MSQQVRQIYLVEAGTEQEAIDKVHDYGYIHDAFPVDMDLGEEGIFAYFRR